MSQLAILAGHVRIAISNVRKCDLKFGNLDSLVMIVETKRIRPPYSLSTLTIQSPNPRIPQSSILPCRLRLCFTLSYKSHGSNISCAGTVADALMSIWQQQCQQRPLQLQCHLQVHCLPGPLPARWPQWPSVPPLHLQSGTYRPRSPASSRR